ARAISLHQVSSRGGAPNLKQIFAHGGAHRRDAFIDRNQSISRTKNGQDRPIYSSQRYEWIEIHFLPSLRVCDVLRQQPVAEWKVRRLKPGFRTGHVDVMLKAAAVRRFSKVSVDT